jgi:hypothetical protein
MGVGGQRHAPAALPPRITRYPLYRRLGGPQGPTVFHIDDVLCNVLFTGLCTSCAVHRFVYVVCRSQVCVRCVPFTGLCTSCAVHSFVYVVCRSQVCVRRVPFTALCTSCAVHSFVYVVCRSQLCVRRVPFTDRVTVLN